MAGVLSEEFHCHFIQLGLGYFVFFVLDLVGDGFDLASYRRSKSLEIS
jgi:hypothetical protein